MGFLAACLLVPFLFSKKGTFSKNIISFLLAAFIIYGLGLAWLVFLYNLSFSAALLAGLYPFMAGEALKIVVAALLTRSHVLLTGDVDKTKETNF